MSETLSQDPNQGPDTLTSGYTLTPSYPSATTLSDPSGLNLPPFSTFAADIDGNGSFSTFGDARLLDISNWDCYTETRLERTDNGISIITSQPQYRPWESKPLDTGGVTTFADAFASQNGAGPRLPSFQSQFQAFNDQVTTTETTTLTTLTPVSPNSTSQNITTLGNFHTLNPRNYPLVPAPIQAREIPSIQQQYMDERHIQLYTHPSGFTQNGTVIQNIGAPAVLTVLKSEPMHQMPDATGIKIQNITTLHHSQFQNPMSTIIESNNSSNIYNQMDKKLNGVNGTNFNGSVISPTRGDYRKKERRKMRASSLESSNESDGASSNMDNTSAENSGQVAAVSSTASFKHQHNSGASGLVSINTGSSGLMDVDEISGGVDKQVKKKRKRCGECIGCQRKDNCGDCAPCRNDKSHQICKQRRCEKLTEKKNLYGENGFVRDGSRRGRGKGRRGGGSCRGRKAVVAINSQTTITAVEPASTVTTGLSGVVGRGDSTSSTTPQSTSIQRQNLQTQQHMAKSIVTQSVSAAETVAVPLQVPTHQPITGVSVQQSSPLASVPFYTEPNRFTTSVWQTDPNPSWTQSQFIQQLGSNSATAIDTTYTTQQYPNNMYQPATYSQSGFEPIAANTYYTGAVQVLTNRSPSVIAQQQHPQQLTPRACGSTAIYTPSPSPSHQPSRPQSTHQLQYEQYQFSNSAAMPTTPSDSQSRPSSVNSNAPTPSTYPSTSQQQQSNPGYSSSGNNNATYTSGGLSAPHTAAGEQLPGSGSPAYTRMECRSSSSQEQPSTSEEVSRNSNAYPGVYNNGGIVNNQTHSKKWANPESVIWESNNQHQPHLVDESSAKLRIPTSNRRPEHEISNRNSEKLNQHRVEINSKIKNMILNKQEKKNGIENEHNSKSTGHFLWNSHHCCAGTELNNGGLKYFRMLQIIETFWNQKNHGHKKIGIGSDRKLSTINEVKNILMQNANHVFPTIKEYITLEITCFRNCDGIQRNRMKNMFSLYIYV